MSKNIAISEGGVGKTATVSKLKLNNADSGTSLWVPEDEVQLTTLHVTENGTYKASDEGYYGYDEVVVNGVGSAFGIDGDGDDAWTYTDENGNLNTEKLPSALIIDTPPTKLVYNDQEPIDFTGMIVKSTLASGDLWTDEDHPDGIIPHSELILPIDKADKNAITSATGEIDVTGTGLNAPVYLGEIDFDMPLYNLWGSEYDDRYLYSRFDHTAPVYLIAFPYYDQIQIGFVSLEPFSTLTYRKAPPSWSPGIEVVNGLTASTYNGMTAYVCLKSTSAYYEGRTAVYCGGISAAQNITFGQAAIVAVNGGDFIGGKQNVPVQWMRPGDYKLLESSFDISLN